MKKRGYERIQLDMKVDFLQLREKYAGTIKNISQNGMYIETNEPLPFHSNFDLHVPFKSKLKILINFNNNVLEIPVRVRRLVKNGSSFNGMGVALVDTSEGYLDFLRNLIPAN